MLMFKRFGFVTAMVCAMAVSVSADQSTPKGAALDFGNAIQSGDSKALRAVTIGTEDEYKAFDAIGMVVGAMKKVSDAAAEKFGKDNPISASASKNADIAAELNKPEVEIKEDGDKATITNKANDSKNPMTLVKKDGKWFVELKSLPRGDMDQVVKVAPVMSKIATEIAADIKAGKFKDAMEAQLAMQTKMIAAMMEAAPKAPDQK